MLSIVYTELTPDYSVTRGRKEVQKDNNKFYIVWYVVQSSLPCSFFNTATSIFRTCFGC